MASWESHRVVDIVDEIDEERYVLPVIQRELVWGEEKMELLFDSLLKGNSFGSIIVIEEDRETKPLFASRRFSKDGETVVSQTCLKLVQKQYFVIDGQQRLQSFYIGLRGSVNGKSLFFDLFSDYKNEYEFQFSKDERNLPEKIKDDRPIKECYWVLVRDLCRNLKDAGVDDRVVSKRYICQKENISDEQKEFIESNIAAFCRNVLSAKTVGVAKVYIDKTKPESENKQKIVELFRRLNDGGTKLSAMDLIASTLKAFDFRMENFLRSCQREFADIGLTSENLIKLLFLLQGNNTKEMTAIENSDASFAIENEARIKNALDSTRKFLKCSKTYDFYKESNRSFIPLYFIVYHLFYKNISDDCLKNYWDDWETTNEDFIPLKQWLYHSLLNGVFRSKGAGWIPYKTGIKKIFDEVQKAKGEIFPLQKLLDVYVNYPLKNFTLAYNSSTIDLLDAQFVFYLMYDFSQSVRSNDVDHIMPKNILREKGFGWDKINSIKNYQLLDVPTNRGEKNGKSFRDWINNPIYVGDKSNYMSFHLIPVDESLWSEENFEAFANARGELIAEKIRKCVGK